MILIADNINIMNPVIDKALRDMNPQPIRELAVKIKEAGAEVVDINPGPLRKNGEKKMSFLINTVQEAVSLRLSLDTPNPRAMEVGLDVCKQTPIINGFSLEPKKLEEILPLAVKFSTDIVGFLLGPDGKVPISSDQRLSVAVSLMEEVKRVGIPPERVIIDPIIVPVFWDEGTRHARDVLSCIRLLPEVLDFQVKTVAGLSNLTSGIACREEILSLEEAYLAMLAEAGLNVVLINMFRKRTVRTAIISDAIMNCRILSWTGVKA